MAIDPQDRKRVDETGQYVKDTLRGVAAELADLFKTAARNATDPIAASNIKQTAKDFVNELNKGARAAGKVQDFTDKLSEGLLSSSELQKRSLEVQKESNRVSSEAASIATQILEDTTLTNDERETLLNILKKSTFNAQQALKVEKNQLETLQTRVKDVEKLTGATGRLLKAVKAFPGLGSFIDAKSIETQLNKYAIADKNRVQVFFKGLSLITGQVIKNLFSLEAIVGRIAKAFFEVDTALVNVTRLTGQTSANFASLNNNIASTVDVLQQVESFTRQTGLAATSVFTEQDLGRLAEAKNLLGLSAEQANNLALNARVSGNTLEGYQESIVEAVNQYNGLNRSTIAHGQVLQDVLNTSSDIAMSLGGDAGRITKAAAAARRLGLELSKVDKIADSLMDFESSIQNELEAQLLTGKNINLAKARELALNNKLGNLADELNRQGVSAAEYSKMNRIQQESLAKALGMSKEELGKALAIQLAQQGASEEAIAAARGMTVEQLRSASVQEKLNKLVSKLAQAFSPVLEILVPIVDGLASIATPVAKLIGQVMQLSKGLHETFGPAIVAGVLLFSRSILTSAVSITTKLLPALGKIGSGIGSLVSKIPGMNSLFGKTTDGLDKVSSSGKNLSKSLGNIGKGIGGFFKGIGRGLSAFATAGPGLLVFAGFAAVATGAIIGIGYALKLAAPAIKAFGTVVTAAFNGISTVIKTSLEGLGNFLDDLTLKKLAGLYALGPALLIAGAGLASFGVFAMTAAPGMYLLAGSLTAFAGAALLAAKAARSLKSVFGLQNLSNVLNTSQNVDKANVETLQPKVALAEGGIVTQPTKALVGEAGAEAVVPLRDFYAKFDELISVVKQGGDVYMDGNKVGQAMVLSSTKLS